MEYISLLGLLVGVNCQPEDVAAGGQSVYMYVCVCECVLLFSTWSLVINQDGGVRGKSSPSAN